MWIMETGCLQDSGRKAGKTLRVEFSQTLRQARHALYVACIAHFILTCTMSNLPSRARWKAKFCLFLQGAVAECACAQVQTLSNLQDHIASLPVAKKASLPAHLVL